MKVWCGDLEKGQPWLSIEIASPQSRYHRLKALVDTGFNGFLMGGPELVTSIGLRPSTTMMGSLADGNRVEFNTAISVVRFAGKEERGAVTLSRNPCSFLLGTHFLRRFRMALAMTSAQVWLFDEREFEDMCVRSGLARRHAGTPD